MVGVLAIVFAATAFPLLAAAGEVTREREAFATDYLAGRVPGLGRYEMQVLMWHEYNGPGGADDTGHLGANIRIAKESTGSVLRCWFGADTPTDFEGIRSASGRVESTGAGGTGDCRSREDGDGEWTSLRFRAELSATIEGVGDRRHGRSFNEETLCELFQRSQDGELVSGTLRLDVRRIDIHESIDLSNAIADPLEGIIIYNDERCS
jgi:hypothetical protein